MTAQELRQKDTPELHQELKRLLEEGFKLRMQHGSGQLTKHDQLKKNQRAIARVKTIMTEQRGTK